jgi:hypothetical protein
MSHEKDSALTALHDRLTLKDSDGLVVLEYALLATVYFEVPYRREVREALVSCCEDYVKRCGEHLRWALHPVEEFMEPFGAGEGSNPREWLLARGEDEEFDVIYHGAERERGASAFSLLAFGAQRRPYPQLGHLRVSFPVFWFADHPGSLVDVLLDLCRKLKPVSGYGGIGVIGSPERFIRSDYEPTVYQMAQRFPGLEIDYPVVHGIWLGKKETGGIKGVNWLTAIGEPWLSKIGGADALAADLGALDSRFIVHRFPGGVVIQAGPRPDLGDSERNIWPDLYVKLAKKLKPIRVTLHGPMQIGGRGLRMDNKARTEAWLRRFEDR